MADTLSLRSSHPRTNHSTSQDAIIDIDNHYQGPTVNNVKPVVTYKGPSQSSSENPSLPSKEHDEDSSNLQPDQSFAIRRSTYHTKTSPRSVVHPYFHARAARPPYGLPSNKDGRQVQDNFDDTSENALFRRPGSRFSEDGIEMQDMALRSSGSTNAPPGARGIAPTSEPEPSANGAVAWLSSVSVSQSNAHSSQAQLTATTNKQRGRIFPSPSQPICSDNNNHDNIQHPSGSTARIRSRTSSIGTEPRTIASGERPIHHPILENESKEARNGPKRELQWGWCVEDPRYRSILGRLRGFIKWIGTGLHKLFTLAMCPILCICHTVVCCFSLGGHECRYQTSTWLNRDLAG